MADPVVDPVAAALPVALPLANGALPAEDPAGEVVASIAQAQTISAGTDTPIVVRPRGLVSPSPRSSLLSPRRSATCVSV